MADLPTEIWLLIARRLYGRRLVKLKSLNSCFFHCYMDMRWEQVEIDTRFASKAIHDLERLADPFVATRTKLLTIRVSDSSKSVAIDLLTSLLVLPNVTSLNITLGARATTSYAATLFQTITSSSMAMTLEKLRLTVYANIFSPLMEYTPNIMEKLTVLFLDFKLNHLTPEFPTIYSSLLRTLAPTLQQLRISDKSHDLSPLFDTLSIPFPHLKTLVLFFYFHDPHQSLLRFLLAHHNDLHYLHLRLKVPFTLSENHLGTWLTKLVNNAKFSSLKTLGIYPSHTPAGLCAALALIKRTAPTLTSLVIYDRLLAYGDVVRVLDALTESDIHDHTTATMATTENQARSLRNLEMCISVLSVPLLDLLACRLPHLEKLSLWAHRVAGFECEQLTFYDLMEYRQCSPDTGDSDRLHTWKLQNLSIQTVQFEGTHQASMACSFKPDKDAERVVVGAVPSLARTMTMKRKIS